MGQRNRIVNAALGAEFMPLDADTLQERTLAAPLYPPADDYGEPWDPTPDSYANVNGPGGYYRYGFSNHNSVLLTAGNLVVLDDSIDWRDRMLLCHYHVMAVADVAELPGGASDFTFGASAVGVDASTHGKLIYTANGSVNAGGTTVAPGAGPRDPAAHGDFRAFLDGAGALRLYVSRTAPYVLAIYNNHGSASYVLAITISATGKLGKY